MIVSVGADGLQAEVDPDDYARISAHAWLAMKTGGHIYAVRYECSAGEVTAILMHREIAGAGEGQVVDHRDRNGLNNRRHNLRVCAQAQNSCNRKISKANKSGFKGVYFVREGLSRPWAAEIKCGGRKFRLGRFETPEMAHAAYINAAQRLHGEFARAQ